MTGQGDATADKCSDNSALSAALLVCNCERASTSLRPRARPAFRTAGCTVFDIYFCSTCANTGVPEQVVMRWLGHQDSLMVRHYYHLHDDEAQRQMQRVNFVGGSATKGVTEGTTDVV